MIYKIFGEIINLPVDSNPKIAISVVLGDLFQCVLGHSQTGLQKRAPEAHVEATFKFRPLLNLSDKSDTQFVFLAIAASSAAVVQDVILRKSPAMATKNYGKLGEVAFSKMDKVVCGDGFHGPKPG